MAEPPPKLSAENIGAGVKAAVGRHRHIRRHAAEVVAKFHPDAPEGFADSFAPAPAPAAK